jgi:hypothetical protein
LQIIALVAPKIKLMVERFFGKNKPTLNTYLMPTIVAVFCLPKIRCPQLADFTPLFSLRTFAYR